MKANAPEKIYFSQLEDGRQYFTPAIPFEREFVVYVPVDTFIKNAADYMKKDMLDNLAFQGRLNRIEIIDGIIEKFIKAMKESNV